MFKQLAAASALVAAASAAPAQPTSPFYAGIDVSSTKFDDEREPGFGGFAGYAINQHVAIEAGFHRVAKVSYSDHDDSPYGDYSYDYSSDARLYQSEVSLIITLPLSKGVGLYNRLGYNHLKMKGNRSFKSTMSNDSGPYAWSDNKVVYGAGLSYAFSPAIAGRLEVQKPDGDFTKVAAGVSYGF